MHDEEFLFWVSKVEKLVIKAEDGGMNRFRKYGRAANSLPGQSHLAKIIRLSCLSCRRLELSDSSCILFSIELSSKTGLIFYLADFNGRNWRIPGFYENKT